MEPNSFSTRSEAQRWLEISEKLLTTRDLVGSKTFATRARESNPRLEHADQILAVVDTLLAGEKRINNHHDLYAILQLPRRTDDSDLVAAQYRRLALLLNPHKNTLPFADQAFKLVSEAWSVFSNPTRKSVYDDELDLNSNPNPAGSGREQPRPEYVRPNPRKSIDKNTEEEIRIDNSDIDESSSFWTACPYCYNMYEYSRVYVECTLRCQNCRRAFQAIIIPSPPSVFDGKEGYFYCWGFFPLGISMSNLEKNKGGVSEWTPISPIFACPRVVGRQNGVWKNVNVGGRKKANVGGRKNKDVRKSTAPRIYIDDDQDVFVDIAESSENSDDEWDNSRKKKKLKNAKGKDSVSKNGKQQQAETGKNVKGGSGENLQGGSVMQEGVGALNVSVAETSKKAVGNNAKRQTGRAAKELGKLDLNVEFSNEVEEPSHGMREGNGAGNGVDDNIEGIGFFEGLDEFLSSLPILSAVGDDKVKAA